MDRILRMHIYVMCVSMMVMVWVFGTGFSHDFIILDYIFILLGSISAIAFSIILVLDVRDILLDRKVRKIVNVWEEEHLSEHKEKFHTITDVSNFFQKASGTIHILYRNDTLFITDELIRVLQKQLSQYSIEILVCYDYTCDEVFHIVDNDLEFVYEDKRYSTNTLITS